VNEAQRMETEERAELVEWVDCGAVAEETKGFAFLLFLEFGPPPFNKRYIF
jgi:hypothetical protein